MHRLLPIRIVLATSALFAAAPALASSTATTTLADFHISLVDLDPSDGLAPSVMLDPLSRSTVAPGAVSPGASTFWIAQGNAAFGPVASGGEFDGAGGTASFAGDPLGAGATIAATGVGGSLFAIGEGQAYVDTQPSGLTALVVGAHTQVTFSGLATVDWDARTGDASAYGEVDLAFWLPSADDGQDVVAQDYLTGGYYGNGGSPWSGSTAGGVMVTYANDSDAPIALGYELLVVANAAELLTVPPPVDEPAGVGLLLAGVATLAWTARRRR